MDELAMFMDAVDDFLDAITPKFSFESFVDFLNDYFDGKIKEHLMEEDCCYLGGFCNLIVLNDTLKVDTELYYERDGQYDRHIFVGKVPLNKFTKKAQETDIQDIIEWGGYKVDIAEPM